jgi:pimeloyl-ACP methyl ester carboxylesterase
MTSTEPIRRVRVTPPGLPSVELAYQRHGAGEPLVLLHGIGHHLQAWDPVVGALAERREVIAFDLPGFGRSGAQPLGLPYTPEASVRVFAAVFSALGLERPHVAGNSLGGLIALRLAQAGQARTVTALSPGGFWSPGERTYAVGVLGFLRRGALALPPAVVERLAHRSVGRAALTGLICARPGRRDPGTVIAETRALRDATGFEATLAASLGARPFAGTVPERVPVTVAWGTRDRILPHRQGARLRRAVPHARLVRLPGCGHVPMNDDPELVARVLLAASR